MKSNSKIFLTLILTVLIIGIVFVHCDEQEEGQRPRRNIRNLAKFFFVNHHPTRPRAQKVAPQQIVRQNEKYLIQTENKIQVAPSPAQPQPHSTASNGGTLTYAPPPSILRSRQFAPTAPPTTAHSNRGNYKPSLFQVISESMEQFNRFIINGFSKMRSSSPMHKQNVFYQKPRERTQQNGQTNPVVQSNTSGTSNQMQVRNQAGRKKYPANQSMMGKMTSYLRPFLPSVSWTLEESKNKNPIYVELGNGKRIAIRF